MGLTSSLFNVTSSRDVPFHQPQQLQCSHDGSTKVYCCSHLCSPLLSPLLHRWWFAVVLLHGFMEDLISAVIAEVFIMLSFCSQDSVKKTTLKIKHVMVLFPFHCDSSIMGALTVMSKLHIFLWWQEEILFISLVWPDFFFLQSTYCLNWNI